ncbi:MAG: zf-HC2 domain-containing protein [Acidobacteriota bacterium]
MVKKRAHPDNRLFDYLSGAVDENAARSIEAHLSVCDDCASVAGLVRELKESASELNSEGQSQISTLKSQEHPDISELASFFYSKTRRAVRSGIASHLALCRSCGEAIAQYARAEKAAAEYKPVGVVDSEVPAKAWEMIRDWEDSSFAKLKPATEVLSQELLTRLARILNEQAQEAGGFGQEISRSQNVQQTEEAGRVPVLVVSRSGEVRSVEFFERAVDSTGARILRHSEGSLRFDNRLVHALLDFGEKDPFVVSNLIRRDTIRLEQTRPDEESRRTDYVIIED